MKQKIPQRGNKSAELQKIRKELIDVIKQNIYEAGKVEVCKRMGFTESALNQHINYNSRYVNNIDKLGQIAECIDQIIKDKKDAAQRVLDKAKEMLSA